MNFKLGKELKQSSIRNSLSLKDINNQILKLKVENIKYYTKEEKKNIINNRCILLNN